MLFQTKGGISGKEANGAGPGNFLGCSFYSEEGLKGAFPL